MFGATKDYTFRPYTPQLDSGSQKLLSHYSLFSVQFLYNR